MQRCCTVLRVTSTQAGRHLPPRFLKLVCRALATTTFLLSPKTGMGMAMATPDAAPATELQKEAPPAPPAATALEAPAGGADDSTLLRRLLALFDPWLSAQERVRVLEDGALTDPRAAPAVAFVLGDPRRQLRAAAARALGGFPGDPRVESALIQSATDPQEPTEVRLAAIASLARVGTTPGGETLLKLTEDDGQELTLREAARSALEARFPALAARTRATEVVNRDGRLLLATGSAVLGSYALGAVGELGRNDAGVTIGVLGGAVIGAGTAFFLTRSGELTGAQAGWMVTGGAWGAGTGMLAAGIATRDPSSRLVLSLGLLGEGAALGAAIATRRGLPYQGGDVAFINLAGLAGLSVAGGGALMSEGDNAQLGRAVLLAGGLVGLGTGAMLTRRLTFAHADAGLTFDFAYEGTAAGFLAAQALSASDQRVGGATLLGLGLGFTAGVALAPITDYDASDVGFVFVVGSYGKLLGLSVPLLADSGDSRLAAGTLVGSVASLGAAHLLHDHLTFKPGAVPFVMLSTALGLWHGGALGSAASSLNDRQALGAALLGGAVGGLLSMPLHQVIPPTSTQVLALTGGTFWGIWFAAWSAALTDLDRSTTLRLTLATGDVGLATAGLLVSPLLNIDARRIGIANLGGLAGAGLASLAAALATKNNDTVITANLVGSGAGLVAGAILAASLELSPVGGDTSAFGAGRGTFGRLLGGISAPQLIPLILPGGGNQPSSVTTMGFALAFSEVNQPAPASR